MNYHLVKFGGHRHCGSEAIYNFSFSKGHVTLWARVHQSKLPSCQVWWP